MFCLLMICIWVVSFEIKTVSIFLPFSHRLYKLYLMETPMKFVH